MKLFSFLLYGKLYSKKVYSLLSSISNGNREMKGFRLKNLAKRFKMEKNDSPNECICCTEVDFNMTPLDNDLFETLILILLLLLSSSSNKLEINDTIKESVLLS